MKTQQQEGIRFLKRSYFVARYVFAISICLIGSVTFAERITLVKNGSPAATIVLPTDAGATIKKAAAELSSYAKKLSGVGLPIRSDGAQIQGTALILDEKEAPLPPVTPPREQHALETFSLRVSDGNVYFGGRSPEAVTYGVLAFIEDNLGVRWFAPGDLWEYLPPHEDGELAVRVSSRVVTPDTPRRVIASSHPSWKTWHWRNRVKSLTRGIRDRFSSNTIHEMFPAEAYGKTNPEYYPLIRGKRFIPPSGKLGRDDRFWPCVSNPDVVKVVVDYLREWFDSHPDEHSFSLGINDVTRHCSCADCMSMDRDPRALESDDLTDRTCSFINAVAKELKTTHPQRYLGMLFYRHIAKAPAKVARLEDTVFGYLACDAGSWWGKDGAEREAANRVLTNTWARVSSLPLSRYEYFGQGTFTPLFNPHAMDRQMKLDLEMGMEGQYTEFYTFLPNTAPMIWAFYRLQWDAALNIDTLLQEFYSKMFGAADDAMSDYYAFLERVWNTPRPGRVAAGIIVSRNVEQQCLSISPAEIQEGLRLLDQALAVAKRDDVRMRIEIIKASLKFADPGVESYWRARGMRSATIKDLGQAEGALAAIAEYSSLIRCRTDFWAEAEKRQDILGESIRALKSRRYLMADDLAFNRIDSALVPFVLNVLDWYKSDAPDKFPEARNALDAMALPESMTLAVKAYGDASDAATLLGNPGFEEAGPTVTLENANEDWDHIHAPKGWSVWVRPVWKFGLPLSEPSVREKTGRKGSNAAVLSAGTGGCFISSIAVKPGAKYFGSVWMRTSSPEAATKAHLTLIFRDANGKLMHRDARKRLQYEQVYGVATKDWQRLAACVTVPREAETLCVMLGHERAREEEVAFDDALLLLAEEAPRTLTPSDLEVALADGLFKTQAKEHLSGRGVRKADRRDGNAALVFAAGETGENSYVKISGIADKYHLTKAMTVEAWIQVDSAYKKGVLEIVGNPVTDRGKGFRLYLNRGVLHFISGSFAGSWKEAKTWGAHSGTDHLIEPSKWHHIAASYDGSVFQVFVDGKLAGKSKPGLQLTEGKPDVCIGSFRDGLAYGFMGEMDDISIYDRALSLDEISRRAKGID